METKKKNLKKIKRKTIFFLFFSLTFLGSSFFTSSFNGCGLETAYRDPNNKKVKIHLISLLSNFQKNHVYRFNIGGNTEIVNKNKYSFFYIDILSVRLFYLVSQESI